MTDQKEKVFEKKQELIIAALNEFGEKGYENASLNTILKEAGISKGTFYYHFKNKEDLYIHLATMLGDEKQKFFMERINFADFQDKDLFSMLHLLTKTGMQFIDENPHISKFSQSFLKEYNSEIYQKILRERDLQSNDIFDSLIEQAYAKNELRDDIPIDFTKRIITHLFTHLQDISTVDNIDDLETAASYLIEFMRNGLANK